jgi:alpha-mannosidase
MTRWTSIFASCLLAVPSIAQFNEAVERQALLFQSLQSCAEGFARPVSGDVIQYPRLRPAHANALICRATSGAMAIEWITAVPPSPPGDGGVCFAVSAGLFGQEESGKAFDVLVNGVPAFRFRLTTASSWRVEGHDGGWLAFDGVMRDQFGDHFGYLRFMIPGALLRPGEPASMRIVGEKASSSAWVMIYEDPSVTEYLRGKVRYDGYCECSIQRTGTASDVAVVAGSLWAGRTIRLLAAGGTERRAGLSAGSSQAEARCTIEIAPGQALSLLVDDEEIFRVDSVGETVDVSRITPKQLIQCRAAGTFSGLWTAQYRTSYLPDFGTSLIDLSHTTSHGEQGDIVSSSHQDIAWMDTPDACIEARDQKVITPALGMFRAIPGYCFDLEDVLELREYVGRHPDRISEIARYITEGRLGIGATFNMPYEDLCSGEMLVRQFYAGRRWLRTNFPACDTHLAWNPDVPGRAAQMPQIMAKAGVTALIISRQELGLYSWQSPDGSSVTVFSPSHYALFSERTAGKPFHEAAGYLASFERTWASQIRNGSAAIPVLSMSDMSAPTNYDEFIHTWNSLSSITLDDGSRQALRLPPLQYSTAASWLNRVLREGRTFPVIRGERPDVWLYIHGPTHHWAIDAKREADTYLTAAETFSTIDALLNRSFSRYPAQRLTEAWESQLYPDHGWGGKNGEITDSIFLAKYCSARDEAREIFTKSITSLATRVHAANGKGTPIVVFNRLSWKRSGPVACAIHPARGFLQRGIILRDSHGKRIPVEVAVSGRYEDGSIRAAEIVFVAEDIPSVGYATYYVSSGPGDEAEAIDSAVTGPIESAYYRLELARGGVKQIHDKQLDVDLLANAKFLGAELFTMRSVGEGAGEWAEPQQPTMEGFDRMKNHPTDWRIVENGPVREVVEYRRPIEHAVVVQRITVYRRLKQIDFETSLLNWDGTRYREFRLAFPLNVNKGTVAYEVPFGSVEIGRDEMRGAPGERYTTPAAAIHPRSIQNWINASDSSVGITLSSSVAVWDYRDPTDSTVTAPLLQPVLLASRKSCHWEGNWYLQAGNHDFRFSLSSHQPGWQNGRRFGVGANSPLVAVTPDSGPGPKTLPESKSFLSCNAENVVVSTMKKAEASDDVIIRVYDADGKDARATISLPFAPRSSSITNIIEDGGVPTPAAGVHVQVPVGHHAIETIRLGTDVPPR